MVNNSQNQTFWQRAKEFAGSNLGRNLIGGLGSGLAVALSGGDGRDALRYGLQGAAATTNAITKRNLYNDQMAKQELDRADKLAESEKSRQFQMQLMNNQIKANKELADINFRNALAEIDFNNMAQANAEEAERQRKIQGIQNNPYLSEQQKSWQVANIDGGFDKDAYFTDVLLQDPQNAEALGYFKNRQALTALTNYMTPQDQLKLGAELAKKGNLMLDPEALNSGQISFVKRPEKSSEFAEKINFLQQAGYNPQQIVDSVGLGGTASEKEKYAFQKGVDLQNAISVENAKAQNAQNLENIKYGNQLGLEGVKFDYGQQGANAQMLRDMRMAEFKNNLPTETQRNITAQANALGVPESAIYQGMYDEQQLKVQQALSNIAKNQADIARTNAEIPYIGQQAQANLNKTLADTEKSRQELANLQNPNYEANKELAKQMAKAKAGQEKAQKQVTEMMPRVMGAINRAYEAIEDGTGLGQAGGMFWTTEQGGINRANIQNAQAQINTLMRGILSAMGVGATEMNSAAEAAAYRYVIDPSMPEAQIKQVLDNFVEDYNSGALMQDLQSVANTYGNYTIERVE